MVLSAVLAALGTCLVGATPSARAASAAPGDPEQPLVPRIRSISPDYVPDKGPIVIQVRAVDNVGNVSKTKLLNVTPKTAESGPGEPLGSHG